MGARGWKCLMLGLALFGAGGCSCNCYLSTDADGFPRSDGSVPDGSSDDAAPPRDSGSRDAGERDGGASDAGQADGGDVDGGGADACIEAVGVVRLDDAAGQAASPRVAADGLGSAMAVWTRYDEAAGAVFARQYESDRGWCEAADWEGHSADVAANASGASIVVWNRGRGFDGETWSRRHLPDGGWGDATEIGAPGRNHSSPRVALDGSGNAVVVWDDHTGDAEHVWANAYEVDMGWGVAALLEEPDVFCRFPQVVVGEDGAFVAVSTHGVGPRESLWWSRYVAGEGWDASARLAVEHNSGVFDHDTGMDADGNAFVVWGDLTDETASYWVARYERDVGWGPAEHLADSTHDHDVRVGVAPSGEAVAVWKDGNMIFAARYEVGDGWGPAERIDSGDGGAGDGYGLGDVVLDDGGGAVAVWKLTGEGDGLSAVWAARHEDGVGWGDAFVVDDSDEMTASQARVAITSDGAAVVVWLYWEDWVRSGVYAAVLP